MLYSTEKVIKNKVGLLNLAEELGNISKACKIMDYSRENFYRDQEAVAEGGVEALLDKSRRKPNLAHRVDPPLEDHNTNRNLYRTPCCAYCVNPAQCLFLRLLS